MQKQEILAVVAKSENIGDLHLKSLLSSPSNYAVNTTLIEFFLKAFYTVLWEKDPAVKLQVLSGNHDESAFVEIKTSLSCLEENRAPMVKV